MESQPKPIYALDDLVREFRERFGGDLVREQLTYDPSAKLLKYQGGIVCRGTYNFPEYDSRLEDAENELGIDIVFMPRFSTEQSERDKLQEFVDSEKNLEILRYLREWGSISLYILQKAETHRDAQNTLRRLRRLGLNP